jgi:archaemetzincin
MIDFDIKNTLTMHKIAFFALLSLCSACEMQFEDRTEMPLINTIAAFDVKLGRPETGEWLSVHREAGQTFAEYCASKPLQPGVDTNGVEKRCLYLQPIGEFSAWEQKILVWTANYWRVFFGLEVKQLPPLSDEIIPKHARRDGDTPPEEQLLSPYILDTLLLSRKPADAVALMAITSKDLYPSDSWAFVFGQGSLKNGVGVASIFRYHTDNTNNKTTLDATNYPLFLSRTIKTTAHELGHIFSIRHCTHANCVMNGSNSLQESDKRPNMPCSVCLRKLYWNIGFKNIERMQALKAFYQQHHLIDDYRIASRNLKAMQK